jgi:hypothetical protein
MLAYGIAILVALLIPLVTRGSYSRLLATKWHWGAFLFAGLAIQIALDYVTIPRDRWHDVGFGLLLASYALILAFCARNFLIRGMAIVFIGIACNVVVIGVNQGMPFKLLPEWKHEKWAVASVKHHPQDDDDRLVFLSDIIVLRSPFNIVISFGDLILCVALCDVAFHASRRPRRRPGAILPAVAGAEGLAGSAPAP